ncbi:MAG TPA: 30S ribosomal protein S12 methylthiotransferase RimO, partial [Cyanobacteria bacterium UBA11691]|nr:30S ribosomal protein S12 methylthiotransferase RimO [Cyanobacteria bacterium UBA11691]
NQAEIGKTVDVLVEGSFPDTQDLIGRCARFAPEVDGVVYIRSQGNSEPLGKLISVKITDADAYDLYGDRV